VYAAMRARCAVGGVSVVWKRLKLRLCKEEAGSGSTDGVAEVEQ
jgi:hypothetical protein